MAQTSGDPFASLRGHPDLPYSDADDDTIEQEIRQAYQDFASDVEAGNNAGNANFLQNLHQQWRQLVAAALVRHKQFQRIAVDNFHDPFIVNIHNIRLEKSWLMAIYLPGFYDVYDTFEEGYQAALSAYETVIVSNAQDEIIKTIEKKSHKHFQMIESKQPSTTSTKAGAPDTTSVIMATLIRRAQEQRRLNNCRAKLYDALESVSPMLSDIQEGQALLEECRPELVSTSTETWLDRFGRKALARLEKYRDTTCPGAPSRLKGMPDFTETELGLLQEPGDPNVVEADEDAVQDVQLDAEEVNAQAQPGVEDQLDPAPEYAMIEEMMPSEATQVFFYPHIPLDDIQPFSKQPRIVAPFDTEEDDEKGSGGKGPDQENLLQMFRRSSSFIQARILSEQDAQQTVPDDFELVNHADAYVKETITRFDKKLFADNLKRYLALYTRPNGLTDDEKEIKDSFWLSFSPNHVDDDWYHVRRLTQAISYRMGDTVVVKDYGKTLEVRMATLLSAISAARDPVPWLPVMDYALRIYWQKIVQAMGIRRGVQVADDGKRLLVHVSDLFNELCLFAHGAAASIIICRHPFSPIFDKKALHVKKWYEILYEFDPRCANAECLRLLPHPSKVGKNLQFRTLFSVGTFDYRVGKHHVRRFISKNRPYAYMCIYYAIYRQAPSKALAVVFFWFGHLLHPYRCKSIRGKREINCF